MLDVVITTGLIAILGLAFGVLFNVIPNCRLQLRRCPHCRARFGRTPISSAIPYYERLHGHGMKVMGGPRRYLGARVIKCKGCTKEFVFGQLGNFVEEFQESVRRDSS